MSKNNPILVPSKKVKNGKFLAPGDPNKKTFIAAHSPDFAALKNKFYRID